MTVEVCHLIYFWQDFVSQFINFGDHCLPLYQLRLENFFAYVHNLPKGNFLRGETQQVWDSQIC